MKEIKNPQRKFHFIPKSMMKYIIDDFKKVDKNKQLVPIFWDEEKLTPIKWNGKRFVNINDINCIDIYEYRKNWTNEENEIFEKYEKKLSELEGYFHNNFFKKITLNVSKESDVIKTEKFMGSGIEVKVTTDETLNYFTHHLGKYKNFNLAKFLYFINIQSRIVIEWNLKRDVDFIEIIKKLSFLIEIRKCEKEYQDECMELKSKLDDISRMKPISQSYLLVKEKSDYQLVYLTSRLFGTLYLKNSFAFFNIPLDNGYVVTLSLVKPNKNYDDQELFNRVSGPFMLFNNNIHINNGQGAEFSLMYDIETMMFGGKTCYFVSYESLKTRNNIMKKDISIIEESEMKLAGTISKIIRVEVFSNNKNEKISDAEYQEEFNKISKRLLNDFKNLK